MEFRVLHLEDSVFKHAAIARLIKDTVNAEIDWVTDVESGIEKIKESGMQDKPYDLAITDMHYPLSKGTEADWNAGNLFVDEVKKMHINLPVIVCSTHNMQNEDAFGCIWYSDFRDWESELREKVKQLVKNKTNS